MKYEEKTNYCPGSGKARLVAKGVAKVACRDCGLVFRPGEMEPFLLDQYPQTPRHYRRV